MPKSDKSSTMINDRLPTINATVLLLLITLLTVISLGYCYLSESPLWFIPAQTDRIDYIEAQQQDKLSQKQVNVVILGSSRPAFDLSGQVLASYWKCPRNSSVNLAFPGLKPTNIKKIIKRHATLMEKSKVWVIGIDDYYTLATDDYFWLSAENDSLKNLNPAVIMDRFLRKNLPIIKALQAINYPMYYRMNVFLHYSPEPYGAWPISKHIDKWIYKGLEERVVNPETDKNAFSSILDSYFKEVNVSNEQKEAMSDILGFAKMHHIQVVILDAPYHPLYKQLLKQQPDYYRKAQSNASYFNQLAKYYGQTFISCRNEPSNCGVSQADFADPVHLNYRGSVRFSEYLAKRLQSFVN